MTHINAQASADHAFLILESVKVLYIPYTKIYISLTQWCRGTCSFIACM